MHIPQKLFYFTESLSNLIIGFSYLLADLVALVYSSECRLLFRGDSNISAKFIYSRLYDSESIFTKALSKSPVTCLNSSSDSRKLPKPYSKSFERPSNRLSLFEKDEDWLKFDI